MGSMRKQPHLAKSEKKNVDIKDLYAVKISEIWRQLKREHFSFWALCAYFLFEYVRPQSIYPEIDILPWAQLFLLLAILGAFMDSSVKLQSNALNKLIITFFCVVLLSSVFAFRPMIAFSDLKLFAGWLIVYFLIVGILNTRSRYFMFCLFYLIYSFKMSQHGFRSWADRGFGFTDWGISGPPGWFHNSGEFAIQMLLFLMMSGAIVLGIKHYWSKFKSFIFYLMPFTALISIIGASSRGAQLALFAACIWLVLRSDKKLVTIFIVLIVIVLAYFFLPDEQITRFQNMGNDNTSLQRMAYWDVGFEIWQKYPILGVGYGNWLVYIQHTYPEGIGPLQYHQLSHNIFIQVIADLGTVGLLLFLLMIVYILRLNAKSYVIGKKYGDPFIQYCSFGLNLGLVCYLVAGFFVSVFYYPFFWVQMGLAAALYNNACIYKTESVGKVGQ